MEEDDSDSSDDENTKQEKLLANLPKLSSIDIKKMSGDQLKDHLKERKLEIQGQKKDLIKRLCDYEAARK